jgi:hypothetical protein
MGATLGSFPQSCRRHLNRVLPSAGSTVATPDAAVDVKDAQLGVCRCTPEATARRDLT